MSEVWIQVKGYDGYFVSNAGRVKSLKRGKEKILKTHFYEGYEKVKLCDGLGGERTTTVHRLVALNFVVNPNNYPQVDHIDGVKSNNNASNLEWVTKKENAIRAKNLGLLNTVRGEKQGSARLSDIDIPIIREAWSRFGGGSQSRIATYYGVSVHTVYKIVQGINWKHL